MIREDEIAGLDPGIRETVLFLNELGFETMDSGDGKTKPARGLGWDDGVRDHAHVVMRSTPSTLVSDTRWLVRRLREYGIEVGAVGTDQPQIQATFDPASPTGSALIDLMYLDDARLAGVLADWGGMMDRLEIKINVWRHPAGHWYAIHDVDGHDEETASCYGSNRGDAIRLAKEQAMERVVEDGIPDAIIFVTIDGEPEIFAEPDPGEGGDPESAARFAQMLRSQPPPDKTLEYFDFDETAAPMTPGDRDGGE